MGQIEELYDRGVAFKVEGNYEEAQAAFKSILELDFNHAEAHHQLGLVYGFIGMFDESIEELTTAVRLNGTDLRARNDLALTYCMLGMSEQAKAEFEAVLSADPDNEVAKKNMVYF